MGNMGGVATCVADTDYSHAILVAKGKEGNEYWLAQSELNLIFAEFQTQQTTWD